VISHGILGNLLRRLQRFYHSVFDEAMLTRSISEAYGPERLASRIESSLALCRVWEPF